MTTATNTTQSPPKLPLARKSRVRTPTVLQMEAVECGAAALGIVLAYYGKYVPLEELRINCGVSRDGSKASNIVKAARGYGFEAKGYKKEPDEVRKMPLPVIVFWNFNHFLVVEGFQGDKVFLNDPAGGPRTVTYNEFDQAYTGVVLEFKPTDAFVKSGRRPNLLEALIPRLRGSYRSLGFIFLASLLLVIPGLVVPVLLRIFIDDVLLKGNNIAPILLAGMVVAAVLSGSLMWLQQYALLRLETYFSLTTSARFLEHVLRLPIEFFTQRYAGEISNRVEINDRVASLLSGELATNVLNAMLVVFYVILMLQYDVLLTMIGVIVALLNLIALRFVYRKRTDANRKMLADQGQAVGVAINGISSIETLKATGTESDFFVRWSGFHAKGSASAQNLAVLTQYLNAVPALLTSLNISIILLIGGLRVMDGIISVGMLVAFQTLMAGFLAPVNRLVTLGARLQEAEGDMLRLNDVLNYAPDPSVGQILPASDLPSKLSGNVEIRGVTFGYSRLDPPLISDFNLTLTPSKRVALIGGSGSGKSTIAKLISGLYKPWEGDIVFDSIPRTNIPSRILSNSLAVVDQEIFLLEGSIRQNITMWDDSIPEADILRATKDACIHDDIADRAGGYDYVIQEGGRNFSGGQRQRLEIARALATNPSILILDEATSALDPIVEKEIIDNLKRRGCTCLIVAHRLSTIRDCDEIIVLEQGKVVQRGTHEEMRNVHGPYATLIRASGGQSRGAKSAISKIYRKLL